MPEVFRHARRRSRYHARARDEAERAHAAERRRAREGGGRARRAAAEDEWRREFRYDDSDDPSGNSAAPHSGGLPAPPSL